MMTIAQGIYQSTTERVDVLGVARDESDEAVVVYRVIDERREMRVMAVEGFGERFKLVASNAEGPR